MEQIKNNKERVTVIEKCTKIETTVIDSENKTEKECIEDLKRKLKLYEEAKVKAEERALSVEKNLKIAEDKLNGTLVRLKNAAINLENAEKKKLLNWIILAKESKVQSWSLNLV